MDSDIGASLLVLLKKGTFTIAPLWDSRPELPLFRSGPLPAILFSVPIKLVGFNNAPLLIVTIQCLLLYVMSLLSRDMAIPFNVNKTLLQSLILLNPNLIGLAHLAQSDILFAFLFCCLLVVINRLLFQPEKSQLRWFVLIGILSGLLCLTRGIGLIISIIMPIILLFAFSLHKNRKLISVKAIFIGFIYASFIFLLVIFPWSARNFIVHKQFFPTLGVIEQLEYNLSKLLIVQGFNTPEERDQYVEKAINDYLVFKNQAHCSDHNQVTLHCRNVLRNAYINIIFSQPKLTISKAVIIASAKTLLTGGSSRFVNSLGISADDPSQFFSSLFGRTVPNQSSRVSVITENIKQISIFVVATGFSLITRLLGLIGLCRALIRSSLEPFHAVYLINILSLLIVYFAVSTSRFRALLEPILMLYAVYGLKELWSLISQRIITSNT